MLSCRDLLAPRDGADKSRLDGEWECPYILFGKNSEAMEFVSVFYFISVP